MRFSQFTPEELAQLAIFLGVALPTIKAMFATYTGYRKLKKMIKKKLAMENISENVNEENVYDMFKKYIAPKIKSKAYTIAAQQLDKLLRKKKGEDGKLRHNLEYYAQRLSGTLQGIDYRTLVDYYRKNYDSKAFENKFTDYELALMEGGMSLDDLDVSTPSVEELAKKYSVSKQRVEAELAKGIEVELEHTTDHTIAREIALDHLGEMLDYYTQLAKVEKETDPHLDEVLKKVKDKWALVSKSDPSKVLQYYRGPKDQKPSDEWVNRVERRVQAFKHMGEDQLSMEPGRWEVVSGVKYYMVTNKSGKTKAFSGPTPAAKKYKETGGKYPWESVNEIKYDPRISKGDWGEEDWDEFIGETKPVVKIKGYEIHIAKTDNDSTHHFLVKDPDGPGFLGELKLDAYINYWQSSVFFDERIQGKGIALPLYAYVVKKGYTLVSDSSQSRGSKEGIWKKLTKVPGIFVYAWDKKYDEFYQWDPDEDLDSEIYYDQDKLYKLEDEYKAKWAELDDKFDDDKIDQAEYERQFALLKDQYTKAKEEHEQVYKFSDVRLVAIADKKNVSEGGVGIITKQNTTPDVKPGETQRQAAKLGMKLDKNNEPPKLHKKAAKNSTPNKLFNLGIK